MVVAGGEALDDAEARGGTAKDGPDELGSEIGDEVLRRAEGVDGCLDNVRDPLRLMHEAADRINTTLTQPEFWTARSFYRRRLGGR